MSPQIGGHIEGLVAEVAAEGPLPRVHHTVFAQPGARVESLVAQVARVRLLARVVHVVTAEAAQTGKALWTGLTLKRNKLKGQCHNRVKDSTRTEIERTGEFKEAESQKGQGKCTH